MTNLEKFLEKSKQVREAATKVVAWYPHRNGDSYCSEATVRGPCFRWFKCTEVSPEYRKYVADPIDDCNFAAHAMNTAETKDEMIRVMAAVLTLVANNEEYDVYYEQEALQALARVEELAK